MTTINNKLIVFLIIGLILCQDHRPPVTPQILGVGGDKFVTVTWNRLAEFSIDEKTGYADFEGYRLYRSTDGGITWGDIDVDIIPKDGEIVGWLPLRQFDLNEDQDIERCVYLNEYDTDCVDDPDTVVDESLMRSINISGEDPAAPWFYLGDNTSINNSYTDTDVINGVEYTYAITAYDMGVRVDTIAINNTDGQITLDTTFNISNPGSFSCPSEWLDPYVNPYGSCPSFESPKLSESFTDYNSNGTWDEGEPWSDENDDGQWNPVREYLINVVTVTPSKPASDISFPNPEDTDNFIVADSLNVGTGLATYRFVDESDLEPALIKIEVRGEGDDDDFEGFESRNPSIYIYRINEDESLYEGFYSGYLIDDLNASQIESYLDMPGASYSASNDSILVPTYYIEDHALEFSDVNGYENNFTGWFNGVQFRFDNHLYELPQTSDEASLDALEFYDSSNLPNQDLEDVFTPVTFGSFQSNEGIKLDYWSDGFPSRAMFDYKIEFHTTEYVDTSFRIFPGASEDFCLDVSIGNDDFDGRDQVSFLPFTITNLTTDRQVRIWHSEYTQMYPSQDLDDYEDCIWQSGERLSFAFDYLSFSDDLDDIDDERTYELEMNYDLESIRKKYNQPIIEVDEEFFSYTYYDFFEFWNSGKDVYEENTIVEVLKSDYTDIIGIYRAKREIVDSLEVYPNFCGGTCPPNSVYDNDGDGLNDNPWEQLYPWDDGDYIIIRPDKWFNDGDSWTVDLGLIGGKENLTDKMIDDVIVIPNPYVVSSLYNEEVYGNRLIFDNLPRECTITIYTATGELVDKIDHGDDRNLDGSTPWDLKNKNGDLVHPGLYFYSVEASGAKDKVGKFVIIR